MDFPFYEAFHHKQSALTELLIENFECRLNELKSNLNRKKLTFIRIPNSKMFAFFGILSHTNCYYLRKFLFCAAFVDLFMCRVFFSISCEMLSAEAIPSICLFLFNVSKRTKKKIKKVWLETVQYNTEITFDYSALSHHLFGMLYIVTV